jgi:hypothetical protein
MGLQDLSNELSDFQRVWAGEQHLPDSVSGQWMNLFANQLVEGFQHESPFRHSGMGYFQICAADHEIAIQQNVQVDDSGTKLFPPDATHFPFDPQEYIQERFWFQSGIQLQYLVQKVGLGFDSPGGRFEQARSSKDATASGIDQISCPPEIFETMAQVSACQNVRNFHETAKLTHERIVPAFSLSLRFFVVGI